MPKRAEQHAILVAVDGSEESDAAVRWATREAQLRTLPVTMAHVVVPVVTTWPVRSMQREFNQWQEDNARQVLEQGRKVLQSSIADSETPDVHTQVLHDYVVPALVRAARSAEMVVVGSRGLGAFGRTVLGSVSNGLAHHARCPVAIVHADEA